MNTKRNVVWKKKHLEVPLEQTNFTGQQELPFQLMNLQTPYDFFMKLFSEELFFFVSSASLHFVNIFHIYIVRSVVLFYASIRSVITSKLFIPNNFNFCFNSHRISYMINTNNFVIFMKNFK